MFSNFCEYSFIFQKICYTKKEEPERGVDTHEYQILLRVYAAKATQSCL